MSDERTLLELLSSLGRKVFKRLMPLLEPVGLSTHEVLVLWKVRVRSVCRVSEISEGTALAPSTLTGVIDRLESKEFVRRFSDPADRRATNIGITSRGEDLVLELLAKAEAESMSLFKNIGTERMARIRSDLADLLAAVEEEEEAK